MLRLFGAFGNNDPAIFPLLQNGVLPLELARDVMADPWAPENTQRVMYSLLLCTMVFSCGEQLPVTHYGEHHVHHARSIFLQRLFNPSGSAVPFSRPRRWLTCYRLVWPIPCAISCGRHTGLRCCAINMHCHQQMSSTRHSSSFCSG